VGASGRKIVDSVRWLRGGQLWVHRIDDLEGAARHCRHDHRIGAWPAIYGRGRTHLMIFAVATGRSAPVIIAWVHGRPYLTVFAPKP
jgi:hypothetical protein